ncbi:MAG TPA: exodeoxyribonuclease V subunit gamma [Noviherbaspirillum sp.]|nr:exodeoxyribonuclease V subunit gamma [Noviherbaspirillum sp.]
MSANLNPGFITLHGNQLEQLRAAVFDWLRAHPLAPLEQEIFLVQSNGVAEWLKIALAEEMGVCAATQVTLPARFLWHTYRAVLGAEAVSPRSAFDKEALTWRLMRLLPTLLDRAGFEPLRHFLADGDAERRLQLAQRLSDLMDQYQVYRADWLADWASGEDVLRTASGTALPLAPDQKWQALLWREIVRSVPEAERATGRADIHLRFVDALRDGADPVKPLPRRVIVFGISALPYQTLQALAALSLRMQVIAAVPNPCQFHWGDIISGRELLTAQRRRQPLRSGNDLAGMPLEELHAHSHPLLAGWGRLGRDFIRMLDEFDDREASAVGFAGMRVDLFSTGEGATLLEQAQAAIRDLKPLHEHPCTPPADADRSIEFHIAHSAQREVEVLHDRLLSLLAESGKAPLRPRDIVVMVPDIDAFTPAIRAVFGQYGDGDNRRIPYDIVDLNERRSNPILLALDWLLRLPDQRCLQSEIRDLLDVPALAARFGIAEEDLPRLAQWIDESGVRWGLDHEHRKALGLALAGEQNAWMFGIRRMLLGYASGDGGAFAGIEPYAEVGGIEADLAGSLASLIDALLHWRTVLGACRPPADWAEQMRALLHGFFKAVDTDEQLTLARLDQSLRSWLEDCDSAGFTEAIPAAVLREAWLAATDEQVLNQRFISGGVTFCTLMPMRAVPYRIVCLLGMNDGEFPRGGQRADFDLLALPQLARPGDRSRRDDDRYLMLEALLSARDKLYISWSGRNIRDNSDMPPSILVSQLRDYLEAGWALNAQQLTTEHPLQPFSRRYFEPDSPVRTYAREWEAAHHDDVPAAHQATVIPFQPDAAIDVGELISFVRQPVKHFFKKRLRVVFAETTVAAQDDEPFSVDGLQEYGLVDRLLADGAEQEDSDRVADVLRERAASLVKQGVLPVGLAGEMLRDRLVSELIPARQAWLHLCARYASRADRVRIGVPHKTMRLDDWLDKLHSDGSAVVRLTRNASKFLMSDGDAVRPAKLLSEWVWQLAAAAAGHQVEAIVVARDCVLTLAPLDPLQAQVELSNVLACWEEGMQRPLPVALDTAIALLNDQKPGKVYDGDPYSPIPGEAQREPCLARLWPDYERLAGDPEWEAWARRVYAPLLAWVESHVTMSSFEDILVQKEAA